MNPAAARKPIYSHLYFQVLVAIPCAYAMAKLKFRAAKLMMVMVMLGLLVPIHATALPLYVAFDGASMLNSYTALVAPFSISVFAIFMFLQFFRAMPDDLIHAARLDGMSEAGISRALDDRAWSPAVRASTARAQGAGVTGVPAFVVDRRVLVMGAQPREVLAQAIAQARESA